MTKRVSEHDLSEVDSLGRKRVKVDDEGNENGVV